MFQVVIHCFDCGIIWNQCQCCDVNTVHVLGFILWYRCTRQTDQLKRPLPLGRYYSGGKSAPETYKHVCSTVIWHDCKKVNRIINWLVYNTSNVPPQVKSDANKQFHFCLPGSVSTTNPAFLYCVAIKKPFRVKKMVSWNTLNSALYAQRLHTV